MPDTDDPNLDVGQEMAKEAEERDASSVPPFDASAGSQTQDPTKAPDRSFGETTLTTAGKIVAVGVGAALLYGVGWYLWTFGLPGSKKKGSKR
jgi:hypothetical protein